MQRRTTVEESMTTPATCIGDRQESVSLGKRIRSSVWFWRIKLFLKRISGREIWLRCDVDVPVSGGVDYHYVAKALDSNSVIYSFGVGDSVDFELELIEMVKAVIHAFDPTPYTLEWIETIETPGQLKFHPWAVAGEDGELKLFPRLKKRGKRSKVMWTTDEEQADRERAVTVPAYSIPSLMKKLGHDRIDLVKMDVEGAEYDALSTMLNSNVYPGQILIEFHHRFPGIGKQRTIDILNQLRGRGYGVFWVSHTGREVGLIRR